MFPQIMNVQRCLTAKMQHCVHTKGHAASWQSQRRCTHASYLLHLAQNDRALALDGILLEVRVLDDVRQDVDRLWHIPLEHLGGQTFADM